MRRRIKAIQVAGCNENYQGVKEQSPLLASPINSAKAIVGQSVSKNMNKVFGFHFFNSTNLSFSPSVNIPVSDSYTLGIGDELVVNVYGASQKTYNLIV